ncbi:acetoin utilization protein AcuC [Rothia sp. LK2588]|uniref:acetoin utilization protein AcuC n=1 Tax=Rothia sp. LK2588 TaxID=3114369 RepID=UPI0034CFC5BB
MSFTENLSRVPTTVLWAPSLSDYFFGDYHPMHPSRLDATAALARELGLFDLPQVSLEAPEVATDEQLRLAHDAAYIQQVHAISEDPTQSIPECGLGTEDTPGYQGIHEASARLAGGSLQAAQAILDERAVHAVNFSGGMHHAARSRASGFCVYNDCAVAIQHLLEHGVTRVAYIDVDAHHGDGTQNIFWDNPAVMTISMHESGMTLFPGTGFSNESGPCGEAAGTSVNIALPGDTSDGAWIRAFDAVVPPLLREFQPEVIVSQHGCDSHFADEMSHLSISVDAQRELAAYIGRLADELCEGRWIATGGGGYSVHNAVPRSWAHLIAIAAGDPLDIRRPTPQAWQKYMKEKYGDDAPGFLGDASDIWWRSWEVGYDPADEVDRTVMATRKEIFPLWGLDPWFD